MKKILIIFLTFIFISLEQTTLAAHTDPWLPWDSSEGTWEDSQQTTNTDNSNQSIPFVIMICIISIIILAILLAYFLGGIGSKKGR